MTMILRREIDILKRDLLSMSTVVEENVYRAVHAIEKRDEETAKTVIETEMEINQMEVNIEEECLKILALHGPVANDLRYIVAILHINGDMERIGDLAANIAERALFLSAQPNIDIPFNFTGMAEKTIWMLKNSLDAFVNLDVLKASAVCSKDAEVDSINREMYEKIQNGIISHMEFTNQLIHLLCVSRHIERIADHAVNIAEDVIYMIEGKIIRHRIKDYNEI